MKKIKRKMIAGSIVALCSLGTVAGVSAATGNSSADTVPVSAARFEETPVIILDAGHGGST